jgi:hypothetical protein
MDAPVTALINADMAMVNSKIKLDLSCPKTECRSYQLCRPDGVVAGEKYIVHTVLGKPSEVCEKGRALKLVEIKPA